MQEKVSFNELGLDELICGRRKTRTKKNEEYINKDVQKLANQ